MKKNKKRIVVKYNRSFEIEKFSLNKTYNSEIMAKTALLKFLEKHYNTWGGKPLLYIRHVFIKEIINFNSLKPSKWQFEISGIFLYDVQK